MTDAIQLKIDDEGKIQLDVKEQFKVKIDSDHGANVQVPSNEALLIVYERRAREAAERSEQSTQDHKYEEEAHRWDQITHKPIQTFLHIQEEASNEWMVAHNMNKYPAVTVIDSGNSLVEGDVEYIDENTLVIRFSSEFGGRASLN